MAAAACASSVTWRRKQHQAARVIIGVSRSDKYQHMALRRKA